jgi:hypothetical protein
MRGLRDLAMARQKAMNKQTSWKAKAPYEIIIFESLTVKPTSAVKAFSPPTVQKKPKQR